jgi:hypothetical protein
MFDFFSTPSERLGAALMTMIAVRPQQPGAGLPSVARAVARMARREIPRRERRGMMSDWLSEVGPWASHDRSN